MNTTYIFLVLLVLCWTINPFMKKKIASKMSSSEYMIYNHGLCSLLIIIYLIYLVINNNYDINSVKLLTSNEIFISIVAALTTVLATILLIKLLKDNDASYVIPHVQPCIILLTLLVGYYMYNEKISKTQMIGTGFIITGLILMNIKNN